MLKQDRILEAQHLIREFWLRKASSVAALAGVFDVGADSMDRSEHLTWMLQKPERRGMRYIMIYVNRLSRFDRVVFL
jgi:hypothetical protein